MSKRAEFDLIFIASLSSAAGSAAAALGRRRSAMPPTRQHGRRRRISRCGEEPSLPIRNRPGHRKYSHRRPERLTCEARQEIRQHALTHGRSAKSQRFFTLRRNRRTGRFRGQPLGDLFLPGFVALSESVQNLCSGIGTEQELRDRADDQRPRRKRQHARQIRDLVNACHVVFPILPHARQPTDGTPTLLSAVSAAIHSASNAPGNVELTALTSAGNLAQHRRCCPPTGTAAGELPVGYVACGSLCTRSFSYRRITSAKFSFIRISHTARAHWARP